MAWGYQGLTCWDVRKDKKRIWLSCNSRENILLASDLEEELEVILGVPLSLESPH